MSTRRTARLVGAHLRAGGGASILVAAFIMVTVFAAAAAPRTFASVATAELHHELAAADPDQLSLQGNGRIGLPTLDDDALASATAATLLSPTATAIEGIPSLVPQPLRDGVGRPSWLIRTAGQTASNPADATINLTLRLAVDLRWRERITFVAGDQPEAWAVAPLEEDGPNPAPVPDMVDEPTASSAPIPIAVSARTADAMAIDAGDLLQSGFGPVVISGIYVPLDSDDDYWTQAFDLGAPLEIRQSGQRPTIQASVYVHPGTIVGLPEPFVNGILSVWAPIDPRAYSYADLDTLSTQAGNLIVTPQTLPDFGQVNFSTELPDVLERTHEAVSTTSALIALVVSGLVGVLVATYALSIQALVRRRRSALSLLSARGASLGQLRALVVLESTLIALPASAIAIAGATAVVPQRVGLDGWLIPIVLAITPVVLAAALVAPGSLRQARQDVAVRSPSTVRWVLEATVAGSAVIALVLLQSRGLIVSTGAGGADPLLSATPLLVAATAGLLTLRLYPIPLRALRAMARTRAAAVWEVGSARAVREPAVSAIAALALVLGVSIVVFTTVMFSTVGAAMHSAVRERLGADVEVRAHDLPEAMVGAISDLPGVEGAVALASRGGVTLTDGVGPITVAVVLADAVSLSAVRPDLPLITDLPDGSVPVVISAGLSDTIQGTTLTAGGRAVTVVGVVSETALPGVSGLWMLADNRAAAQLDLEELLPGRVLVSLVTEDDESTVGAIADIVRAGQSGQFVAAARVSDVHSELASARAAPITRALESSLAIAAGASLILTMLVVALASAASTLARNRVVGVLRILGMTPRQVRALVAWEFGPVAVASIVVGSAVGIGLPYLVTAVLDLRAFFGGASLPQPVLEPGWIAIAVGSYTLAIAAAVLVASALGRRFAPASTLKMGEA